MTRPVPKPLRLLALLPLAALAVSCAGIKAVSGPDSDGTYRAYLEWKRRYLYRDYGSAEDRAFILYSLESRNEDWFEEKNVLTVSEAHGYGMLALATMAGRDPDAKRDFDAMYRFFDAHRSRFAPGLMAWRQVAVDADGKAVPIDGELPAFLTGRGRGVRIVDSEDADSAFDGDADIAYALLLADDAWGSEGAIDYGAEALRTLAAIMEKEIHPTSRHPLLGDWVTADPEKAAFLPVTRCSDFMIGHFAAFASRDPERRAEWLAVREACLKAVAELSDAAGGTGLLPDFAVLDPETNSWKPAPPLTLEDDYDGDYNWNSCRVPWRLGTAALSGDADPRLAKAVSSLDAFSRRAAGGDPARVANGYLVSSGTPGDPIPDRDYEADLSFVAPFLVAARAADPGSDWELALARVAGIDPALGGKPLEASSYFGNSIRLFSLMAADGTWKTPGTR